MRVGVKEGWADKETGKKGEPRLQFQLVQYLQDVLPTFAKKLIIHFNIKDLHTETITRLSELFQLNKGEHQVTFEVLELEKIKRMVQMDAVISNQENLISDDETESATVDANLDSELAQTEDVQVVTEVEETKVITRISMPSRKLKIRISNELLAELEKLQINFKLN